MDIICFTSSRYTLYPGVLRTESSLLRQDRVRFSGVRYTFYVIWLGRIINYYFRPTVCTPFSYQSSLGVTFGRNGTEKRGGNKGYGALQYSDDGIAASVYVR